MTRTFRILAHEITVLTDDASVFERLDDIAVNADDCIAPLCVLSVELKRVGQALQLLHDGRVIAQSDDMEIALRYLHIYINDLVFRHMEEHLRLHAGAGTYNGRLFLVTGDRGAGKTTLLLQLMFDGADIHCDENVLLREGRIQTFPRKLYVKAGTLDCLPRMAAICARKRSYPGFYGGRFYFFDPTEAGLKWYSRNRPPDAIFHLVPDFGKKPELKECPKIDMARCLLFQSLNIAETPGPQIAYICRMLNGCRCYSLRVGDPAQTSATVKKALE